MAVGRDGGLCDGGRGQEADRGVPGWDGQQVVPDIKF